MEDGRVVVSVKVLATIVGSILAGLGLIATAHAQFVVPSILNEVDAAMDEAIQMHNMTPHPGAIEKDRWAEILKRLDTIDARLRDLEKGN